jgi:two-component system sensor histidine kinase PilS (NtrC family)
VSALIYLTGGIDSLFSFVYVFVVIGGAMTLFRGGAIIATLSCLLPFAVVVLIQANGWSDFLHPLEFGRAAISYFMYAIGLGLVGALASALAETVRATGQELAQTESALERLEEQHAAILSSLPAGLLTVDPLGLVDYANAAALRVLGIEWAVAHGSSLEKLVPAFAEPWRRWSAGASTELARERHEGSLARLDGSRIQLGFSFAPLSSDPKLGGTIVVFQDVTDLVRLKESVERAERLATVGKLAAGLAHEVRNPLASMCASIEVLRGELDPPSTIKRLMDNVVQESERLNKLITDFLNFARPRELDRAPTDVSLIVASVTEVFRHEAEQRQCRVVTDLQPGTIAPVDDDRLRQVIWNLARNAVEAMRDKHGGVLTISTRKLGDEVDITIRDTGTGIPAAHRRQIFDPFFTTKDRGNGLGLAIAHAIVQAHGGRILVTTNPGEGTEFNLRLPATRPSEAELPPSDEALDATPSPLELLTLPPFGGDGSGSDGRPPD